MTDDIKLKDFLISLKNNIIIIILIYLILFFLSYLIENNTGYKSSIKKYYAEYKVYPIEPLKESEIASSLTLTLDSAKSFSSNQFIEQKNINLYWVDSEKILNDFNITIFSDYFVGYLINKYSNQFGPDLFIQLQKTINLEHFNNPNRSIVSINTELSKEIKVVFKIYLTEAVDLTQNKVVNHILFNIESIKKQLMDRKIILEKLISNQRTNNIEKPNLDIQIFFANSNLLKIDNIDLQNIKTTRFLNMNTQPIEKTGLSRYAINLTYLSILISTILSIIFIFVRIEKKD